MCGPINPVMSRCDAAERRVPWRRDGCQERAGADGAGRGVCGRLMGGCSSLDGDSAQIDCYTDLVQRLLYSLHAQRLTAGKVPAVRGCARRLCSGLTLCWQTRLHWQLRTSSGVSGGKESGSAGRLPFGILLRYSTRAMPHNDNISTIKQIYFQWG